MDRKTRAKIKEQEEKGLKNTTVANCKKCGHKLRIYKTMVLHEWRNREGNLCQGGACWCNCISEIPRKPRTGKKIPKLDVPPIAHKDDPLEDLFIR